MTVTKLVPKRYGLFGNATANKLYNLDALTQVVGGVGGAMSGNLFKLTPTYNNNYLFAQGETKSYTMTPGEVVALVAGAGYPTNHLVPGVVSFDGYIFVMDQLGNIVNSAVADPTSWPSALNTIQANARPDGGVTIAQHLNLVVAFKEYSLEMFYDAANPVGSPLSNYESARADIGCAAAYSVAGIEGHLFWVSRTKEGSRSVHMLPAGQVSPVKVSGEREDNIIASFAASTAILSSMRAHCVKVRGHVCYVLTDSSQNITLVFDLTEREWYYWTSTVAGIERYIRFYGSLPSTGIAAPDSSIVTVDEANGDVYFLDPKFFQDTSVGGVAQPLPVTIQTGNADAGVRTSKTWNSVEPIGDQSATTLTISWSDNDYQTFSAGRVVDMSQSRPIARDLGASQKRAFVVRHSDNKALRLQSLELDFDIGT